MPPKPDFDVDSAHRYFSANCFNLAWNLIEKVGRTSEDDRQMILLNQASIWHWTQRPDGTSKNLSIGYWQASRIQALLGRAAEAQYFGELCLAQSDGLSPFYVAYAYEALARAAKIAGDNDLVQKHLATARKLAAEVRDTESRQALTADLDSLS
jgi:hypothetical protein